MDEKELIDDITSRFGELKNIRAKFESGWQEVQKYVSPSIYSWSDRDAIPETPKRYASEPCKYMKTLVSGLVGYSVSPSLQWFKLSLQNKDLMDSYGVKDWLEKCDEALVSEFNRSNLYNKVSDFIQDGVTIGHGVMLIDEDLATGRLRFTPQRSNEIYLDINAYGDVDTVFRDYKMSLRQMVELFGLDAIDEKLKEDYKDSKKRGKKINILFAVYPRKEYKDNLENSLNMPYAAVYIDLDNQHIIQESGYRDFPYAVYNFKQIPGYAYSESLAANALPDIKFLNIANETSIKIAQICAEPPLKASSHLKQISVVPRGVTTVERPDDVLEVLKTGDNYPITLEIIQDKKQVVKDWFNVDFFLMLESAENKQMTATEVMERQGEKAAILSDLIVSLNTSLSAIIKRSFNILMRNGRIPQLPESVAEEALLKIDYEGPLAQAQKKYYSTGNIQTATAAAANVMQVFPDTGDYIDQDMLMKKMLAATGMPESVIREDKDVQDLRQKRAEAQAQQQQQAIALQQQQQMIQNLDKLNKPVENGSMIDEINRQLSAGMGGGE